MRGAEVSVLVLGEDAGAQVQPALVAVLKKAFGLVVAGCGTHRIEFLPADAESKAALHGKVHAGPKAAALRHRVLLAGKIADQVKKASPDGFVAYHSDGDRKWSARGEDDFPDYARLREAVMNRLTSPRRLPDTADASDAARIDRLFLLSPYWELEAWLYQNTAVAIRLCAEHDGGRHHDLFREWEAARSTLDEVEDTKDVCCLGDQRNQTLAESAWPAQAAYDAGTSFAASVDRMRVCDALLAALERTRSG